MYRASFLTEHGVRLAQHGKSSGAVRGLRRGARPPARGCALSALNRELSCCPSIGLSSGNKTLKRKRHETSDNCSGGNLRPWLHVGCSPRRWRRRRRWWWRCGWRWRCRSRVRAREPVVQVRVALALVVAGTDPRRQAAKAHHRCTLGCTRGQCTPGLCITRSIGSICNQAQPRNENSGALLFLEGEDCVVA